MPEIARPLLIAITDRHLFQMQPAEWARAAITGGVDLIQVREKDLGESDLLEFTSQIVEGILSNEPRGCDPRLKIEEPFQGSTTVLSPEGTSARQHGHVSAVLASRTQVQINNSPNIARILDCGLHLPESEPLPAKPQYPLSRSIHSLESAINSTSVDFLIAGHVFATPSKSETPPRGLDWLTSIANAATIPVVAIGGITSESAAACIQYGASGVAVISAIAGSDDPWKSASILRNELDRAWEQRHD